jgi:hypothetical protein
MASKHGIDFWRVSAGQVEDYVVEGRRGFRSNPLFFVVVLPLAFLPWIALLPSALRGLRRTDPSPAARFSLLMALAAGTSFLFWSLWPAKNPHYALVFLAPLAAIVGGWFAEWSARPMAAGSWDVRSYRSVAVIAVACVLAIAVGLAVGLRGPNPLVSPSKQFAERIREEPGWEGATLAVYRRRLPSLSFYAGRAVAWPQDPEALAPFLTAPGTRFLVIRARHLDPRQGGMGIGYASTDEPWVLIRLDGPSDLRLSPPPPAPGAAPPAGGPR